MAGRRGRPARGDRRIDAAIDHFKVMGYKEADIRRTIKELLEVYGRDNWLFLEEDAYRVVQEALLEKEEQQKAGEEEEADTQEQEQQPQIQEEEAEHQEAAMYKAPLENDMPIVELHNQVPYRAELTVEEMGPMLITPPALEAKTPRPAATGTSRPRRPCFGWLSDSSESESESDSEEQPANQGLLERSLPCKRKHPSRWDVKPVNWDKGRLTNLGEDTNRAKTEADTRARQKL